MRFAVAIAVLTGCVDDTVAPTCDQAANLGTAPAIASVATCGRTRDHLELPGCDPVGGDAATLSFRIVVAGRYEVCADSEPGTRVALHSVCPAGPPPPEGDSSDDTPICLDAGACATLTYLDPGPLLVFVAGPDAGSCPILDIAITAVDDGTAEADCLDGADDDGDGFTDCEDRGCQLAGVCDSDIALPEQCNRQDDAAVPPFGAGVIDELACRCVSGTGCDALATGNESTHVCHVDFAGGVCAPRCDRDPAWCAVRGGTCVDGFCRDP